MKYVCYYNWGSDRQNQAEAIRRFRATGGNPPAGMKLLGRWTQADFMGGVAVAECDDPTVLTEFALQWSDVMELKTFPVVDDNELVQALERAGR